jgi:hypothetical protein
VKTILEETWALSPLEVRLNKQARMIPKYGRYGCGFIYSVLLLRSTIDIETTVLTNLRKEQRIKI